MRCAPLLVLCVLLAACAGPRERVVLVDAQPGEQVTVTTTIGTQTLSAPGTMAEVFAGGRTTTAPLTPEALERRFGAFLAGQPEAGRVFTFYFATGTTALDAAGRETLAQLLTEVGRRVVVEVEVTGHTDQTGDAARNDRLSLARAEALRLLLWQGGLTATFVRVVGMGSRAPLVNAPGQAEARNRRVEVLVR